MSSLEEEFKTYVETYTSLSVYDNTASMEKLDFTLIGNSTFHVETKEKRQPYSLRNWQGVAIPEEFLFILDDLSARKVLAAGPNSGLLVRDWNGMLYFFSVLDLFEMPKVRFNRSVKYEAQKDESLKGKWAIDLRNGQRCNSYRSALTAISSYIGSQKNLFSSTPCHGSYQGEAILMGGITRKVEHRQVDYLNTR